MSILFARCPLNSALLFSSLTAVGCADPVVPDGATLDRTGDRAIIRCNLSALVPPLPSPSQWILRCVNAQWRTQGTASSTTMKNITCTTGQQNGGRVSSASFSSSSSGSRGTMSFIWDLGQMFTSDTFPLSTSFCSFVDSFKVG